MCDIMKSTKERHIAEGFAEGILIGEVMVCLEYGLSVSQIAVKLSLSEETVLGIIKDL